MTKWYYSDNNTPVGPISEEEFAESVSSGRITEETLVWRDGMADWQRFGDTQVSAIPEIIPEIIDPGDSAVCSECGNLFSKQEMISFQDKRICGACKPFFVQKLKEGVGLTGEIVYAGFRVRFAAKMIDGVILFLVYAVLSFFGKMLPGEVGGTAFTSLAVIIFGLQVIVDSLYAAWFVGKFGATPGKMIFGIRIVFADGEKVGYGWALVRHFAEWISGIILGIGYLMAAFDDQKRTLHDRICGTRVIRK